MPAGKTPDTGAGPCGTMVWRVPHASGMRSDAQ